MAGCAFVVAKEIFHHRNGNILKLWEWVNDKKTYFFCLNPIISINISKTEISWFVQFSPQPCTGWVNQEATTKL